MRWFPDLGLSIVVLGNTTYFPAERTVRDAIDAGWAAATGQPGLQLTRTATAVPAPHHRVAPEQVETVLRAANLVIDFDEAVADELFTVNMNLDEPRAERRERFTAWRDERQLPHAFSADNVTMITPLKGTVTVPSTQGGDETVPSTQGGAPENPAHTSATITVSLDHLGKVQTISLSS